MLRHQLSLADQPVAAPLLRQLGAEEPLREMVFKGFLYRPNGSALALPAGTSSSLQAADWVTPSQLQRYLVWRGCAACCVVPRLGWLVPLQPGDEGHAPRGGAGLQRELADHFADGGAPQLVAGFDGAGTELTRFFVAGDNWPGELSPADN